MRISSLCPTYSILHSCIHSPTLAGTLLAIYIVALIMTMLNETRGGKTICFGVRFCAFVFECTDVLVLTCLAKAHNMIEGSMWLIA